MSDIQRFHTNARMSQIVIANGIVHLAGQVPDAAFDFKSVTEQTNNILGRIDALLADDLTAYLQGGGRKIETWTARHPTVEVLFDDATAFANINTLEELHHLAERR